jgi:hypothetical protein
MRKLTCEQLYIEMDKSIEELSVVLDISVKTIYRWAQVGNWIEKKKEIQSLEKQININMRRALNQGLKSFASDPSDKDLQSLVSLLKQFQEQNKPTLSYKDNIIKFLDKTTDFLLEKNMNETADVFKSVLNDLAEFLLRN